jgi:hypothetical protein
MDEDGHDDLLWLKLWRLSPGGLAFEGSAAEPDSLSDDERFPDGEPANGQDRARDAARVPFVGRFARSRVHVILDGLIER